MSRDRPVGTRVYLGRLPRDCRERDVEKFVRGYGRVHEVSIKLGYGFVVRTLCENLPSSYNLSSFAGSARVLWFCFRVICRNLKILGMRTMLCMTWMGKICLEKGKSTPWPWHRKKTTPSPDLYTFEETRQKFSNVLVIRSSLLKSLVRDRFLVFFVRVTPFNYWSTSEVSLIDPRVVWVSLLGQKNASWQIKISGRHFDLLVHEIFVIWP